MAIWQQRKRCPAPACSLLDPLVDAYQNAFKACAYLRLANARRDDTMQGQDVRYYILSRCGHGDLVVHYDSIMLSFLSDFMLPSRKSSGGVKHQYVPIMTVMLVTPSLR